MKQTVKLALTIWQQWFRIITAIFILGLGWGILCPNLVGNSTSDLGVALGILLALLVPGFALWIVIPVIRNIKKLNLTKKENEKSNIN
jgi:TRAP-type C4-dicarboxylate transport system permease small subunit